MSRIAAAAAVVLALSLFAPRLAWSQVSAAVPTVPAAIADYNNRGELHPSLLGDVGESCRARSDCRRGLRCVAQTCRHPREGTSCRATADCADAGLACRAQRCVPRFSASILASAASHTGASASGGEADSATHIKRALRPGRFDRTRFFVGLSGGPSVSRFYSYDHGSLGDTYGGAFFALRAGVLFGKTELAINFAPRTQHVKNDVDQMALGLSIGGYLRITDRVYWPMRLRHNVIFGDTWDDRPYMQIGLDLVGVALRFGDFIVELNAPSASFTTDFKEVAQASWAFRFGLTWVI
ncbi:MAG: hypothetical protein KC503_23125 [Myxococcales bacterium]|nr:hypothetical protein [Myxococcales bacterium]